MASGIRVRVSIRSRSAGRDGGMRAPGARFSAAALANSDRILTTPYCRYGPVFPENETNRSGSNM